MPRRTRKSGFTLVEVLVVLVIVGILAAIVLSAFARARAGASRTSCSSNLRQISFAMAQYAGDYADTYPPHCDKPSYADTDVPSDTGPWDTKIGAYLGARPAEEGESSSFMILCPSDDLKGTLNWHGADGKPIPDPKGSILNRRTYSMAGAVIGDLNGSQGQLDENAGFISIEPLPSRAPDNFVQQPLGRRMSEIPAPAQTLMLVENPLPMNLAGSDDEAAVWGYQGVYEDLSSDKEPPPMTYYGPLHSGGWNYLFCDGHVKWLRQEQTWGKGSEGEPRGMWTRDPND